MKLEEKIIKGLFHGSSSKPYRVTIKIKSLSEARKDEILEIATSQIDNLNSLISGEFPQELSDIFLIHIMVYF